VNSLKALIIKYKTRLYDIVSYSTGNAISQLMNMLAGFLIIRALDKTEYGYYTIAFTIFIMLTQLSDIGVSIGLNSIGGRTWSDKNKFSALIVTAESIRRRMILYISLPITIYGFVILLSNGNNLFNSLALLAIVAVTGFFEIERLVLLTIPKFYGNIKFIRNNELMGGAAKLLLVIIAALLFKNPIYFLIPFFIATAVQLRFLRMEKKQNIIENVKVDNEFKTEIIGYIKSNALNTFYYIFQGQLFILLLTFFGKVTNIAEIGALSRFSVIFNVVNSLFLNYFIPDFAKSQGYIQTKKKLLALISIFLLIGLIVIALFSLMPQFFLLILGKEYYGLEEELILIMISSSLTALLGILWQMISSKGWVNKVWLFTPFTIISQILLVFLLDLSTIKGIIFFNIFSQIAGYIVICTLMLRGLYLLKN
jgi:O-antigen/teichoic acid export membrane protein